MIAILDTSSLLAFVRYYLPFDKNGNFMKLLKDKFENGEIIVIDKVVHEAEAVAKGIILEKMDFIKESKNVINTSELLPYKKFYNLLENQFCDKTVRKLKGIGLDEFEIEKKKYVNGADAKLILYAQREKALNTIIVTEESGSANDNKIFKKISTICEIIDIPCCTLPQLFKDHFKLNLPNVLS